MKKRRKLIQNDSGMSLIELIVATLIIGLMTTFSAYGIAQVNRMDSTGAAEKVESVLEMTRMQTLSSSSNIELVLKCSDTEGYYGEIWKGTGSSKVLVDKVSLGNKGVNLVACQGTSQTAITPESDVSISFQKSNGSYASSYDKIIVRGYKTKNVVLVKETGRCYVE